MGVVEEKGQSQAELGQLEKEAEEEKAAGGAARNVNVQLLFIMFQTNQYHPVCLLVEF